jgi:hypothetical protein
MFKCIKCPLHSIVKDTQLNAVVADLASKNNQFLEQGLMFIKHLFINNVDQVDELAENLDERFVRHVFRLFNSASRHVAVQDEHLRTICQHFQHYQQAFPSTLIDGTNMSHCLGISAQEIPKMMLTNVQTIFYKMVCRYVNIFFGRPKLHRIENLNISSQAKKVRICNCNNFHFLCTILLTFD